MITFSKKFIRAFKDVIHHALDSQSDDKTVLHKIDWRKKDSTTDIRQFIKDCLQDSLLYRISAPFAKYPDDKKVINILKLVRKEIKYIGDIAGWKTPDYWQTPAQTYQLKKGDCEDGALLLLCIARTAGVPANKIRLTAGTVALGGHVWVQYRADEDMQWRILDWCYSYDARRIEKRPRTDQLSNYKTIWWQVNDARGYGT